MARAERKQTASAMPRWWRLAATALPFWRAQRMDKRAAGRSTRLLQNSWVERPQAQVTGTRETSRLAQGD